MKVLRWGRSAYETDAALESERVGLEALGCSLSRYVGPTPPVEDAEILVVTSKVRVGEEVLSRGPRLKLVLTTTSGYEHLDLAAAADRGVETGRCPIARRDAVVDTSLAMALSLLRALPQLHDRARAGVWARGELPVTPMGRIRGLGVGLIGYGVIGRAAERVWSALGATVSWHDPGMPGSTPLDVLLAGSRVVSVHCGHTESSHRIIRAETLAQMGPGTILVNTARGKCVDLDDLARARHLGGIGLDVFPTEPPDALAALANRPDTILLPHAAGYHDRLGAQLADEVVETVGQWLSGRGLPHAVLPAGGA